MLALMSVFGIVGALDLASSVSCAEDPEIVEIRARLAEHAGRWSVAVETLRKTLAWHEACGRAQDDSRVHQDTCRLARALAGSGEGAEALDLARTAVAVADASRDRVMITWAALAEAWAHLALDAPSEAARALEVADPQTEWPRMMVAHTWSEIWGRSAEWVRLRDHSREMLAVWLFTGERASYRAAAWADIAEWRSAAGDFEQRLVDETAPIGAGREERESLRHAFEVALNWLALRLAGSDVFTAPVGGVYTQYATAWLRDSLAGAGDRQILEAVTPLLDLRDVQEEASGAKSE